MIKIRYELSWGCAPLRYCSQRMDGVRKKEANKKKRVCVLLVIVKCPPSDDARM